ncbi:MAG: DHH family phosphoesterase [Methanosarcinales archaeon]|jgi:single-stranded DNA-specific DHH superfamily exonuclease|nr:DHH family phosphoesterase [Methanosarcinales archaeon]
MVNYQTMPEPEKIRHLKKHADSAARLIKQYSYVCLVTHNDSDGLTSAAIMIQALKREGITYYHKIFPKLDASLVSVLQSSFPEDFLIIFCDIGSGQAEFLSALPNPMVILDHHVPVGKTPAKVVVNPMTVGLEGSYMISGAGVSYLTARAMNEKNADLSSLAVAGMIGDRQLMVSANADILAQAKEADVIVSRRGLKVGDGALFDIFMRTTEPYLDITGKPDEIRSFLAELDLDENQNIHELTDAEMDRLCDAVLSKLAPLDSPDAVEAAAGEIYYLKNQLVENVFDFAGILDSCSKEEDYEAAIALCLGDKSVIGKCFSNYRLIQETLIKNLAAILPTARSLSNISYIYGKDLHSAGNISTTYIRYVNPSRPFVCLNENDGVTRISARGTRNLIKCGLDLSVAIKAAAESVGGSGGGHNIASGGLLPPGKETVDAFIKKLNEIVGAQLSGNSAKKEPAIRISGTIRFMDENGAEKEECLSEKIVTSLAPDNIYGTKTTICDGSADISMESEKIGSLLATADDLLMNADGAVRVKKASQKRME